MSETEEFHRTVKKHVWLQYCEELAAESNHENSELQLGANIKISESGNSLVKFSFEM